LFTPQIVLVVVLVVVLVFVVVLALATPSCFLKTPRT
jgi:hypothetical protein